MNQQRVTAVMPYMKLDGEQQFQTENYVSTPPALLVLEANGDVWTLGFNQIRGPRGEYAFDVLRNGQFTGQHASRIERRAGRVRIFTVDGFKTWSGNQFI